MALHAAPSRRLRPAAAAPRPARPLSPSGGLRPNDPFILLMWGVFVLGMLAVCVVLWFLISGAGS
jgi:hypothetical protein